MGMGVLRKSLSVAAGLIALLLPVGAVMAQEGNGGQTVADRPWMNKSLSPDERADLVLKQMTLDEKIGLLHGTGMAHVPNWQTPLTYLSNGGAGMTVGVPRLGIPNIYMSDAAYGVRSSGENGRYSTALKLHHAQYLRCPRRTTDPRPRLCRKRCAARSW